MTAENLSQPNAYSSKSRITWASNPMARHLACGSAELAAGLPLHGIETSILGRLGDDIEKSRRGKSITAET